MAATEIKVQMQQRRDTAAGWTSAGTVLLEGELGYETDTGYAKLGDGSTAWGSLGYLPAAGKALDGTEALPGISFRDDTSLGLYRPATDELGISTNGNERVRVSSGGNVGIGTKNPAFSVHVAQTNSGDAQLYLEASSSSGNDAEILFGETSNTANRGKISYPSGSGNRFMSFTVNGSTEAIRIKSDGNVGIQTATPNFHLDVNGNIGLTEGQVIAWHDGNGSKAGDIFMDSDDHFVVRNTSSVNESIRVRSDGRFLINTSTPRDDFFGSTGLNALFNVEGTNSATRATSIIHNSNDAAQHLFVLGKSRGTAAGSVTAVSNNDPLGAISFQGADGAKLVEAARIEASADDTTTQDDIPGRITFSTKADTASGTLQERVRIDSSGQVGIGTSSPSETLTLNKNTGGTLGFEHDGNEIGRVECNSAALYVKAATGEKLIFESAGGEAARFDTGKRLIVGHNTSLDNAGVQSQVQIIGDNAATASLGLRRDSDNGSGPLIIFGKSRSSSKGGNTGVQNNDTLGILLFCGGDGTDVESGGAEIKVQVDGTPGSNDLPTRIVFGTTADNANSATERLRIGNQGHLFATCNDNSQVSLTLKKASAADAVDYFTCLSSSNTEKFTIKANGTAENATGSFVQISDVKLKENIVDASSQWDDIKAIQIRNWNFKEETGYETHTQIGVVAQELETVCPGLVDESPDRDAEGNDLGTVTKSVKQSILYMKAVKALQEAMNRIETLEAKVAALEAR